MNQPMIDYARPGVVPVGVPAWAWSVNAVATLVSIGLCLAVVVLAWQQARMAAAAWWVLAFAQTAGQFLIVLPLTLWWTRHVGGGRGKAIRLLAVMPGLVLLLTIMALATVRLIRGPVGGH